MITFPAKRRPMSPLAAALFDVLADSGREQAARASRILDYATFCGWQEDGNGGRFELWTLRKAIPGHPEGSTVTRETLEGALFPSLR